MLDKYLITYFFLGLELANVLPYLLYNNSKNLKLRKSHPSPSKHAHAYPRFDVRIMRCAWVSEGEFYTGGSILYCSTSLTEPVTFARGPHETRLTYIRYVTIDFIRWLTSLATSAMQSIKHWAAQHCLHESNSSTT